MNAAKPLYMMAIAAALGGALSACSSLTECGSSDCASDLRITAAVEKSIDAKPALRMDGIHVATFDHIVYLNGLVDTEFERADAVETAGKVPGVAKVVDKLAIRGNDAI